MEQRYETFTLLIMNISRCVHKIKNNEMADIGLKGRQVQCLFSLSNSDNGASLTDLCEMCGEDKGMMSRTLKELIERELVYVDGREGRKYRNPFKLTEKGNGIANLISRKISQMLDLGSMGITENDRLRLYETLTKISCNLTEICSKYES